MDKYIREKIVEILIENKEKLKIPLRQKSKFEGWLKIELAGKIELDQSKSVEIEARSGFGKERSDIRVFSDENIYDIELKTPNTNWRIDGIESKGRPITKNLDSIVSDAKKLNSKKGIVAFVLFPVPCCDNRWEEYINRIAIATDLDISIENNCSIVTLNINELDMCNMIVCAFNSKYYKMR